MKIKFEDKQQYQLDAIQSVVQVFEGEGMTSQQESTITEQEAGSLELAYRIIGNQTLFQRVDDI